VTTLLFGILATIGYVSGHRREEERLRRGVAAQAEELAAALALPVWNIDRAQIDKILDRPIARKNRATYSILSTAPAPPFASSKRTSARSSRPIVPSSSKARPERARGFSRTGCTVTAAGGRSRSSI
jgi:hypothetical protein